MNAAMQDGQLVGLVALGWIAASLAAAAVWVLVASSLKAVGRFNRRRYLAQVVSGKRRDFR